MSTADDDFEKMVEADLRRDYDYMRARRVDAKNEQLDIADVYTARGNGAPVHGLESWLPEALPPADGIPRTTAGRLEHATWLYEEGLIGKQTLLQLLEPGYFGLDRDATSTRFTMTPAKRSWFKRIKFRIGVWFESLGLRLQG